MTTEETCQCEDCKDSDDPCHGDCDREEECSGCQELRLDAEDYAFEIEKMRGKL
jgi:hypothetical protein